MSNEDEDAEIFVYLIGGLLLIAAAIAAIAIFIYIVIYIVIPAILIIGSIFAGAGAIFGFAIGFNNYRLSFINNVKKEQAL